MMKNVKVSKTLVGTLAATALFLWSENSFSNGLSQTEALESMIFADTYELDGEARQYCPKIISVTKTNASLSFNPLTLRYENFGTGAHEVYRDEKNKVVGTLTVDLGMESLIAEYVLEYPATKIESLRSMKFRYVPGTMQINKITMTYSSRDWFRKPDSTLEPNAQTFVENCVYNNDIL